MNLKEWIIGGVAALALIVAVLVGVGGNDQSLTGKITALEGKMQEVIDTLGTVAQGQAFGGGTRFANGLSTDSTSPIAGQVRSTTLLATATTTQQELTLGSRFAVALSFTAPTTSGSLAVLTNTGAPKVCQNVELDFTGAPTNGFQFSVGTSTSATVWSSGIASGLIASTTVATNTTPLLDSTEHVGGYNGSSFIWGSGVSILAGMNTLSGSNGYASTTDWAAMSGSLYTICHTR